jgi:hypothetical protein
MKVSRIEPLSERWSPGLHVRGVICIASAHRSVVEANDVAGQQLTVAGAPHHREQVAEATEPVVQRRGRQIDILAPELLGKALDGVATSRDVSSTTCSIRADRRIKSLFDLHVGREYIQIEHKTDERGLATPGGERLSWATALPSGGLAGEVRARTSFRPPARPLARRWPATGART